MWVPKAVVDWFQISKDSVDELRTKLAAAEAENSTLKTQLAVAQTNFDWLRIKVNSLEFEKAALIERAYNIKLPAPEITRTPVVGSEPSTIDFSYDDIGDELAKKFGLPVYDS